MTGATKTRHQSSSYCTGTDTLTSFQNISLLLSFHTSVLLVRVPLLDPVASISPIDHSVSSSRRSDTPGKANKRPGRSIAETASTHLCVSTYQASWACCFPSRVNLAALVQNADLSSRRLVRLDFKICSGLSRSRHEGKSYDDSIAARHFSVPTPTRRTALCFYLAR
ncbi:uncharacterized protein K489DRAFT_105400 [Dissoconium aciculare CBS 342.82]|uniref:Uncharacterized protein n=1 Tax=Dissoconium aciculare CBS 342.82 TaxID=1314786 RepID=A0A6J3MGN9_9PEZI|nr:uncharacterized protein K489DRAFT_105400 [Dissoconium aciculare CBS 342.82]KAF1826062.1 hypothetical protein K489DRAFT_105400 [Dissoconium aciculare CBS 342.82]